jgi:hypothetical protein
MNDPRSLISANSARIHQGDKVDDLDQGRRDQVVTAGHAIADVRQQLDIPLFR